MKSLWYNIKDSMIGFNTIEKEQNKSHAGQLDLYRKIKSNLFLWQVQSGAACFIFAGPIGGLFHHFRTQT